MTGFGRGRQDTSLGQFSIEIKSVNHRYNSINLKLPPGFSCLEHRLEKCIRAQIKRGQIYVTVVYTPGSTTSNLTVHVDQVLLAQYQRVLCELRKQLGSNDNAQPENLINLPGVLSVVESPPDERDLWNCLEPLLNETLTKLQEMRHHEGKQLQGNLRELLESTIMHIQRLRQINEGQIPSIRQRLHARLTDLLTDLGPVDETRLMMEVGIMADKADVTEELARLESHCTQFRQALESEEPVGRRLDFLLQEMHREANTIASKNNDQEAASLCIHLKVQIEKMRELVQNVE